MTSVVARGLAHEFPGTRRLFENLDLTLRPGEVVAVVGPSGSGKSTLLSILAGWVEPVEGSVERTGIDHTGWVLQNPHGVPGRTALDHVVLPLLARGRTRRDAEVEAIDLLDRFDLADVADRPFRALSGGEAQRLMLARAVATANDLLLVDEPTAQLDMATAATVNQVLLGVAQADAIVVVATHDPHTRDACTRVIDLTDYQCAAVDDLGEVGADRPRAGAEPRSAKTEDVPRGASSVRTQASHKPKNSDVPRDAGRTLGTPEQPVESGTTAVTDRAGRRASAMRTKKNPRDLADTSVAPGPRGPVATEGDAPPLRPAGHVTHPRTSVAEPVERPEPLESGDSHEPVPYAQAAGSQPADTQPAYPRPAYRRPPTVRTPTEADLTIERILAEVFDTACRTPAQSRAAAPPVFQRPAPEGA
ncbi:MAG: ATP-binding cassette domain-containing protein [Propionibacteriaceae bacterium]|nr:ATP-binding cassette domain-containing protein [Propionibacteriaceae bacterium]